MKKLFSWVEIPAVNIDRAVEFYNRILDVKLEAVDCGIEKMAFFPNQEGAISYAPGFKPSKDGVLVTITLDGDLNDVLDKIKVSGGKVVKSKTKIEAEGRGYFALFEDSEGNCLGLYSDR